MNSSRVDWNVEEEAKGHMSCCTLQEMLDKIPILPPLEGDYKDDTDLLDAGQGAPPSSGTPTGGCNIDLDQRTGGYPPFILKNGQEIVYPEGSRILSASDGETLTLFCHGTPKRTNFISMASMGLDYTNAQSLDLKCIDQEFVNGNLQVSLDKIYSATCTRIMEPLIERQEGSDCSKGLGADGRTDDLDSIVHVRIGWDFGSGIQDQVH